MRPAHRDVLSLAAALALVLLCASVLFGGIGGGGAAAAAAPPDGYIAGCAISFSGDDTVIVQPGLVRDKADAETITVAAAITLTTADQAFAAGTGGGLDVGTARVANTWYYAHLANSSPVAILISTSRTAPTLPGGVTRTRWIGCGRADASADWLQSDSYGDGARTMWYVRENTDGAPFKLVSGGGDTTYTNVAASAVAPPEGDSAWLWMRGGASALIAVTSAGYGGVNYERLFNWNTSAAIFDTHGVNVSLSRLQNFKYRMSASSGHVSLLAYTISCDGTE